ncbi:MAG: hypothetical protein OEY59_10530 [Deltaproteobacteria bacterium]|nr:hypothetical protein [Deltaproteobacteria bacterium]
MNKLLAILCLAVLLGLSSCSLGFFRKSEDTDFNIESIEGLQFDYKASCKVNVKTLFDQQSGSCQIVLTKDRQFRLRIYHPIGGAYMIFYMDQTTIQMLLPKEKKFYQFRNNWSNRERIERMPNLTVLDLQEVLWGRRLKEGDSSKNYTIKDNRIQELIKQDYRQKIEVKIMDWLSYNRFLIPRKIIVHDTFRNQEIKIVITELDPGKNEEELKMTLPDGFLLIN